MSNAGTSFLSRVSSSAAKVYNSSKSYSSSFKYSAEKLESVLPRGSSEQASTNSNSNSTSRWQEVLITATSLASLSKESRQRLRYCLGLLKLANTRLASTISKLQDVIDQESKNKRVNEDTVPLSPSSTLVDNLSIKSAGSSDSNNRVTALKQDLISTIQKVLTVISTFAGSYLPEPARSTVKSYILLLPSNWLQSVSTTTTLPASISASSSGSSTPNSFSSEDSIEAGSRVLVLANETLKMLGNIISIVDDTLERADSWCGDTKLKDDKMEKEDFEENGPRHEKKDIVMRTFQWFLVKPIYFDHLSLLLS